jgi:hypothetical protein
MKKIKAECKARELDFSDFMRDAALAAMLKPHDDKSNTRTEI